MIERLSVILACKALLGVHERNAKAMYAVWVLGQGVQHTDVRPLLRYTRSQKSWSDLDKYHATRLRLIPA